ncbi:HemK2/MTQ2 family protein methyltransferase [Streptomyces lateritius]|uniref:HemK2/MTQ2 family protein methyltransferase n=1 Tax=Streptomyces lateritius TaxID=67313 RepID=UPI00167229B1|nr:HemK2/MTQ2 family protein methyltransferase [Streptomyces lateritius]GGT93960.1 methyltransferase [Streptomyces lateritius]
MRVIKPPGVYAPQGDTKLLMEILDAEDLRPGARALDLCTGTGILAIAAARRGMDATAVDVSRRAVATAWLNARLHARRVRLLRGDLSEPVAGERFDLVTANPPYVPAEDPDLPARGARRAWDAGLDGRLLIDRICRQAPQLLNPDGVLLLVQSSLSGTDASLEALHRSGLNAEVVRRRSQPFGPVMSARARWFEQRGLVPSGRRTEELVVIRATHGGTDANASGTWDRDVRMPEERAGTSRDDGAARIGW